MKKKYLVMLFAALPITLFASFLDDPLGVTKDLKSPRSYLPASSKLDLSKPMGLSELVEYALLNSPDTKLAWIATLSKAQSLGVTNSSYLPSLSASGSMRSEKVNGNYSDLKNGALTLSYLLYDFGGREAVVSGAKSALQAAIESQNEAIQSLFLAVAKEYFSLFSLKAKIQALLEDEKNAKESLEAAKARYKAGVATLADKLQAQTAYSQALLNRQKAEGELKNSYARLLALLGLDANRTLLLLPPKESIDVEKNLESIESLIEAAKELRPDLRAVAAQIEAARAGMESARSEGAPTISLSSSLTRSYQQERRVVDSSSVLLSLNIPIFTGFGTTYKIKSAELALKQKELEYEKAKRDVSLDVIVAYNDFLTTSLALNSSRDLLASAEESWRMAEGRYKAGVGNILELLSAQSALASAKQQNIEAIYGWYMAKISLLKSIGKLDFEALQKISNGQRQ